VRAFILAGGWPTSGSRASTRVCVPRSATRVAEPERCPHRITYAAAGLICTARRNHPDWGRRAARLALPAARRRRLAGDQYRRGSAETPRVDQARRRRYKAADPGVVPATTHSPKDFFWTADFEGEFRTADDQCYPLTVADLHTRYLWGCTGLQSTRMLGARAVIRHVFREYGLPRAIRTDNGFPLATTAVLGLSTLRVCWICLGRFSPRVYSPRTRGRTALMRECTSRCSVGRSGRRARSWRRNSGRSIDSERSTTTSASSRP
jgi:hypothetical protein